jgi:hypothetical protein
MTDLTEIIPAADYARVHGEAKKQSRSAKLHQTFADACRARRLPDPRWKGHPEGELRFAAGHKEIRRLKPKKTGRAPGWSFDFAWPEFMVAVEIQGLVMDEVTLRNGTKRWVCMGGHATPQGYKSDCEKLNAAQRLGWTVLYFEQDMLKAGMAIDDTLRMLYARGCRPGATAAPHLATGDKVRITGVHGISDGVHVIGKSPRKKKTASAPRAKPARPSSTSALGEKPAMPVSVAAGATAAPVLSAAVQEVADAYPRVPDADMEWPRATILIHGLIKNLYPVAKLVAQATRYRRQYAAQQANDRMAGRPQSAPMTPSEFFSNDIWLGSFPIPVDERVQEDQRESEMDLETWKASKYAKS